MAQRRMFSLKIVDTDAFLDMSQTAQLLYYHLAMRADDDGFVSNPKKIMRMVGSAENDYALLCVKKFVIPFESGVCVIKHWLIHNLVRGDRYVETQYLKEKSQLSICDKTKKYSLPKQENDVIPTGNQMEPQVRLGKVRLGKVNKITTPAIAVDGSTKNVNKILDVFQTINPGINYAHKRHRESAAWLIDKFGEDRAEALAVAAIGAQGQKFAPTITNPTHLKEKLAELNIFYGKEANKPKVIDLDNL